MPRVPGRVLRRRSRRRLMSFVSRIPNFHRFITRMGRVPRGGGADDLSRGRMRRGSIVSPVATIWALRVSQEVR